MKKKVMKQAIAGIIDRKGDCIPENKLIELAENKLPENEKAELAEHMETCRRCTKVWAEYKDFADGKLADDGDDSKNDIYKKIIPKQQSRILTIAGSYYAIAAVILLAVTIGTIIYYQNEIHSLSTALQQEREKSKEATTLISTLTRKIDASQQDLEEKERNIQALKKPVAGVPYYDLYTEDIYSRGADDSEVPRIQFDKDKPVMLILNLAKPVKVSLIVRIIDATGGEVWKLEVPGIPESSVAILLSGQSLAPGVYEIIIEESASGKRISLYRIKK